MASTEQTPIATNGSTSLAPRKFKASDLPLPSATRSAIENLAHSFKKKGGYDAIRKQVWEKFAQSVCRFIPLSRRSGAVAKAKKIS
ncbi:hypothetical protein F5Y15DRAFT_373768, partial [Xylariaceae sp. FL0016]